MLDFSRTINLFFWFSWSLSIVTILSSTISTKKTDAFLSLFIFEKKVIILSLFIKFFIVNNRFFNTFIAFFKSSKTIESWITFFAILIIFFARAETFEYIFFWNARNLCWCESTQKTKTQLKTSNRLYEKKEKKKRRKSKEFVVCWN